MSDTVRLNRFISMAGAASRRKGEVFISESRVTVNGEVVTDPAFPVNPGKDVVTFDGVALVVEKERRYFVLNKPTGVIVSRGDTHDRTTVYDLLDDSMKDVVPVGRLDADTSGVLLLTDDGDLTHRLSHPSFGVKKLYRARIRGEVTAGEIKTLKKGVMLDDGLSAPATMTTVKGGRTSSVVDIAMHQGRKRQVRRMLLAIGHQCLALERLSFGGITAEGLDRGLFRQLEDKEVKTLHDMVGLNSE